MGYREALKRGGHYKESEIGDVCVSITTETSTYSLAFIEFETRDFLGIRVTRQDFTEGFVVLNKKYVESISIVYQGDISFEIPSDLDNFTYI